MQSVRRIFSLRNRRPTEWAECWMRSSRKSSPKRPSWNVRDRSMRACKGPWLPCATNWNRLEWCVIIYVSLFVSLLWIYFGLLCNTCIHLNLFCYVTLVCCVPLFNQEIHGLQKEKEETKQRCEALEREKLRVERQLDDTSTQVNTSTSILYIQPGGLWCTQSSPSDLFLTLCEKGLIRYDGKK